MPQLRLTAQAARPDARTGRQLIELKPATRNQGVAHVFSLANCGNLQPRGKRRGHVLHAVDRQIDALFEQRVFQFLDENAFAADDAEGALPVAVSRGADDYELGGNSVSRESGAHKFCLPASQRTAAGPNPKRLQGLP